MIVCIMVSDVTMEDGKYFLGKRSLKLFVSTALFKICNHKIKGRLQNIEGPKITKSKNVLRVLGSWELNSVIRFCRKRTIKINLY